MMRNFLALLLTACAAMFLHAQSAPNFFQPVTADRIFLPETAETVTLPAQYLTYAIDFDAVRNHLRDAPAEGSAAAKSGAKQIQLPLPDGRMETFRVWYSPVMAPELAAKYPMIKTFGGRGITDPTHTVRLGYGLDGFHAVVLSENGGSIVAPMATNQTQYYLCFSKGDIRWEGLNLPPVLVKYEPMEGVTLDPTVPADQTPITLRGGGEGNLTELRVYQFALACTGEYGSTHGGTIPTVLSSLVTATNALNSVVERDADMRLLMHPDNDEIIFLNPDTDPYFNSSMGGALLEQNENILNQIIGLSNFDVGHVFTGACSDVGGVVSGSVCSTGKARGVTCHFSDNVVATTLSIAAHEMGHQFSAGHTFNNCPGSEGQHHSGSAWEPGSGSTILSYQGSCGQNNIPGPANVHYHGGTVEEYWVYTHLTGGNVCPTITETGNHSPVVTLSYSNGFYIPISTPFELKATATDADGDALTYAWEQVDLGPIADLGSPVGTSPSFRSYGPVSSNLRVFPRMPVVLNNGSENVEVLPTYSRELNFRCTVRDNNVEEGAGGITWEDVMFKATESAGPFLVTYPNDGSVVWKGGQEVNVTWNVANTTNALVNCKAVSIRLSTDGGQTYPHALAVATPNDGSELVFVPDVTSTAVRLRVEAADNIFFDLSNQNFTIEPADVPGFTVAIHPQLQQICVPNDGVVAFQTGSVLDYNSPIQLEVLDGLPAGVTAAFDENPVQPGDAAVLTFDMGSVTDDGIFEVTVQAASESDTIIRTLFLNLVYNDFSGLALLGPADGQSGLDLLPTFTWTDLPQADLYDFQLSSSPTFAEEFIVDEGFNFVDAFFTPDVALEESTVYYWRVRPSNECGEADFTTPKSFQTFTVQCAPFPSSDVPKAIPNVGTPVIESKLPVLQSGTINSLNVSQVKGNHDALNDLEVTLVSPQGTEVTLFSGVCGNISAFDFALKDISPFEIECPPLNGFAYKPEEPLATLAGENTLGEWVLRVAVIDPNGQGGVLQDWALEFCSSITPQGPVVITNDTLYVKPLATRLIYNFELTVEDVDNLPSELQFTIVDSTDFGYLTRDGQPLSAGDHFTMREIYQQRVAYTNTDPDAVYDFFTFVVEDGDGGWVGTPRFNIVIDENAVTGTADRNRAGQVQVFPNPANKRLTVNLLDIPTTEAQLRVTDVQGRLLSRQTVAGGTQQLQLNLESYPSGLYFLTLQTQEGMFSSKFVVEK